MIFVATAEILGGAGSALTFDDLDGDTDGIYHIEYSIPLLLPNVCHLEFNDDTTGLGRRLTVNSAAATAGATAVLDGDADDVVEGRIVVNARRTVSGITKHRRYRNDLNWDATVRLTDTDIYSRIFAGIWQNSADNITKLAIVAGQTDQFGEGSWARLYRLPEE
jgi:hypothetical protein